MDVSSVAHNVVTQARQSPDYYDGPRIKKLREDLGLTQEDFAHLIGVTFATVNRWENGRTIPNKVAQKVLSLVERKRKERDYRERRKQVNKP